jgi:hypothetical protein
LLFDLKDVLEKVAWLYGTAFNYVGIIIFDKCNTLTMKQNVFLEFFIDRLCGLVIPGYRSRGPGTIPGATRFSEK